MKARKFLLALLIFLAGCGQQKPVQVADLSRAELPADDVTLLIGAADDTHVFVLPPHGKEIRGLEWNIDDLYVTNLGVCRHAFGQIFCDESYILGAGVKLIAAMNGRVEAISAHPPSIGDVLKRLVGGPPQGVEQYVDFGRGRIGVTHDYGFTLFVDGRFCQTIELKPNAERFYGTANDRILLFESESSSIASPEGWRVYDDQKLCRT